MVGQSDPLNKVILFLKKMGTFWGLTQLCSAVTVALHSDHFQGLKLNQLHEKQAPYGL